MKKLFAILFAATTLVSSAMAQMVAPVLNVEGGKIQGIIDGNGVAVYRGIPYAAPPVGENRWRTPQPVIPWEGIKICDHFGPASIQNGQNEGSFYWKEFYQEGNPPMSEDCLYLNVWTPAAATDRKLPVMVWIHGGAFQNGFSFEMEFDGDAYAAKDVILVTVGYRLGMLGFMSHPLLTRENWTVSSGNWGLYDQLAALTWVKDNIAGFGGDPDNVTLFGQSAGAASVQVLISSPLTKGLVSKAIIQSGGGLGGIIQVRDGKQMEENSKKIWEAYGATTLEQMRAVPAEELQNVVSKARAAMPQPEGNRGRRQRSGLSNNPVIDGRLITAPLDDVAKAGDELDIPYMIGYVADDISPKTMLQAATDWSLLQEEQRGRPSYVYLFQRDLPGEDMERGGMKGAFHSCELWYTFGTLGKCWRPMEKGDYELSERMVTYWTNFAKTGNPNGPSVPQWSPYTKAEGFINVFDVQ